MSPVPFKLRRPLVAALCLAFALPGAESARPVPVAPVQVPAAPATPARCVDEESFDLNGVNGNGKAAPPADDPRLALNELVRSALERSQIVGASQLLAEAALADVEEAKAAKAVQASIGGTLGPSATESAGYTETSAVQAHASLAVSQLIYDGGRTNSFTDWRVQLAEAARQGNLSQREQIAVNTVALALERSRYRAQVQVFNQYVRKMACLTDSLDIIVKSDRGRASELLQARKSWQQAEIALTQAQSQLRQTEIRLRRFVGDGLPGTYGLASVLLQVPELERMQAEILSNPDIEQVSAQAQAADRYADAVAAGNKPQLSWSFIGGKTAARGGNIAATSSTRNSNVGLGIAVNIPLLNPGVAAAGDAARKRALAAAMQRDDAIDARRYRMAEVHEQTLAAFDRARRTSATLRDSDQVRNFTLQQWQQLGRRSLFDVMSAEADHYLLRVAYVNAIYDGEQMNAILLSLGRGVTEWLR